MKLFLQNVSKIILLFSILFTCSLIFAQENSTSLKEITGKVTHLKAALSDVNIINKSRNTGTKTNTVGNYSMHAKIGDKIQFSYVGFKTISITVEDVTKVLNIEMITQINELEEAVVTVKESERLEYERSTKGLKKFKTVGGVFHPNGPYGVGFMDGKDIHEGMSLAGILNANAAGVELIGGILRIRKGHAPVIWDLDGVIYRTKEPLIDYSIIKDMYLVRSGGYVRTHYGMYFGGVVIIRTIGGPYDDTKTQKEDVASQYTNKNYYKNDASTNYTNYSNNKLKEISGKITHLKAALTDVNIINKNRKTGTKTNTAGNYSMHAKVGDRLQFSYVGMKTVTIVVEDVTSILNIEMITKINELQEAVVILDRKPGKELERALKSEEKFTTSRGIIDPKASGFSIGFVDGEDLNSGYSSLANALNGKIAGINAGGVDVVIRDQFFEAIWDVDGVITDSEPSGIDLNNIKDVHILRAGGSTMKYGTLGRYGVVVVRTNGASFDNKATRKKDIASQYTNKNYYKEDANTNYSSYSQENTALLKEITGKVSYQNAPLPDVNILNKNQSRGAKTNAQGNYTIQARTGDELRFSYVGFKTVTITVEDIASILNIEMVIEITELDETVVKTNTNGREYRRAKRAEKKFNSSMGFFNPRTAGYAISFIDGEEVKPVYPSIKEALRGKIPGYKIDNQTGIAYLRGKNMSITQDYPVLWEVDGIVYDGEPVNLDLSQIKNVHALKSLAATTRYGGRGAGGVIVISTINGSFDAEESKKKNIADQYTNQDYYNDDAIVINKESFITNEYTKVLTDIKIKQKAFAYYNDSLKTTIKDYNTHIGIAQDFTNYYKDRNLSSQILKDLASKHNKNPEILKAIAFQMQEYDLKKDAIEIYKNIFKIRPKYAQSYRDLANAYTEDNQYKKAWKMYMSYLLKGNDVSGEGIGQILYNEMEWLYFNRKSQSAINVQFVPKSENIIDFRNDIRLVFEWNTSEAEFDLEFVNPQKQVYNFEHSLFKNQNLISDEKEKGYSSKEFIIDDVKQGQWLVNLTYKGNKKPEPTYLKVTKYYYWGKPNQHRKTSVYKLDKEHEKIQLYRLNKQSLLVSNK